MACGALAFKSAKINVNSYKAYEIDKYAIKTVKYNFPDIEECGDVFKADFKQHKDIDYLIGGSPCTYWSIAQSPDKRETTASGIGWELFSQYVKALNEVKPKYFVYENNKSMAKAIYNSISETFGFEPIMINSALVSAQNRQRYYWVGKRNDDGTYSKVDIKQPEDKCILLRDILDGIAFKDKQNCIDANYYRGRYKDSKVAKQHFKIREDKKSNCLTTVQKDCLVCQEVNKSIRVGIYPTSDGRLLNSQGMRIYSVDGKGVAQSAQGGGMGAKTGLYAIPVEFEGGIPTKAISFADGKTYKVYKVKNGIINIKEKQYPIKLVDGYYIIRKLTVSECKRLQTVPEWYEFPVSDTQSYKMLGNGWTVEVIAHILKSIKENE